MARIEKSIEVNVPVSTAYGQWTQFEDFPRFMESVEEVQQMDDTHLHWRVKVGLKEKEFDAEITDQVPDQLIAWQSIDGTKNAGTVRFFPIDDYKTRITVEMEYDPEGFVENVSDIVGMTSRRVEGDMQHFKAFIESRGTETGQWREEVQQGQVGAGSSTAGRQAGASGKGRGGSQMQSEQQRSGQKAAGTSSKQASSGLQSRSGSGSTAAQTSGQGQSVQPTQGGTQSRMPTVFGGWEDPFLTMRRMADEMERMFEGVMGVPMPLFGGRSLGGGRGRSAMSVWTPLVEIEQQGDNLVVRAELPGVGKEDLQVEIQDSMLTIQGERREESTEEQGGYRRTERRYGQFYRAIQLPEEVDPESAQASIRDGVLEVVLPAPRRPQGRRLEIREEQQESTRR